MSTGEEVASLHVDVSAKIGKAESDLRAFEQRLDKAAARSQQMATQVDAAGKRTVAAAGSTKQLTRSLNEADQAMTGLERALTAANRNAAKQERDQQRLADEYIRGATASRDYGRALEMLTSEQQRAGAGSLRFAQLETQKIRVMDQATRAAERQQRATQAQRSVTDSFRGSAMALAGTLGLTTAGSMAFAAVVQRTVEGFKLAAQLDQNRRSLNTLIGDQQRGNQVFETAIRFGETYGFTQREMGTSAQAAALLMKDSTTAAEKQFEVLARLASLNADEGISGATFATKELASGDIESIVERFNLGRAAANRMKAEVASGKDVFQVLDAELNRMNVTVDVLKNRMEGAAGSMYRAQQANENLTLSLGRLAESKGALDLVNALASGLNNVARSLDYGGQLQQFNAQVVEGADGFADYLARLNQANAAIPGYLSKIPALTEAQYAYAQSLRSGGMATEEAINKARGLGELATLIQNNFNPAAEAAGGIFQHLGIGIEAIPQAGAQAKQTLQELGPQLLNLAATSDGARAQITGLVQQLIDGTISVPAFRTAVDELSAAEQTNAEVSVQAAFRQQELATAMQTASAATVDQTAAMDEEIVKSLLAEAQSQQLTQRKAELESQARAAAAALLASGDAGAAAAARLATSSSQVDQLTAAFYRLQAAQAQAQAYQSAYADYRAGERDSTTLKSPLGAAAQERQNNAARAAQAEIAKQQREAAERAAKAGSTAARKAESQANAAARKAQTEANKAAREQDAHEKARLALLGDQERLLELQKKLTTNMGETDRLELLKDIQDLEKKIADERERQVKAAIDARLLALDDRKKRREEAKEQAMAQRVLQSSTASEDMKAAARDVLERIPLEQQKRAEDIASKARDASGTSPPTTGAQASFPTPRAPQIPATPSTPITTMPVGMPSMVGAPSPQVGTPQIITTIDLKVYLDSREIAAEVMASQRQAYDRSKSRGAGGN